ncbi:MAG: LysR family transcriptional regulator [Solirubrobacteraceae bacterium]
MELRQLQYFAAAARHRHVTRAAEALHVTQPALSQQIRRLEAELGVALLHRTPHGVVPTVAGEELLVRAERILAEVEGVRAGMGAHAGGDRGVARLAAAIGDADGLADALAAFGAAHPGIGLALRQATAVDAITLLRRGTVDLVVAGLTPDATLADGLSVTPLDEPPLRILLPAGDPAAARSTVSLWDLRERPFVLAEEGSALRTLTMEACAAAGFGPVPRFAVADPPTVRRLVGSGLGVALAPAAWAAGDVVAVAPAAPVGRYRRVLLSAAADRSPAAERLHAWLSDALDDAPTRER